MSTRLTLGDTAPDFTLPDADGKPVSLADYRGRRVVVYFYPAAGTPGCTKEACDFRDNLAELNGAGLDVLGQVPRKAAKHVTSAVRGRPRVAQRFGPHRREADAWEDCDGRKTND